MLVAEVVLTNKQRYDRAFLIKNDVETDEAVFFEINDDLDKETMMKEAKDYFILDKEGIHAIFGDKKISNMTDEEKILIIGV